MRGFALVLFLVPILSAQTPDPYTPLTGAERWDYYLHQTFLSPGLYFAALGEATGAQMAKDPPEWGQGLKGYTRRSATIYTSFVIQRTVAEGSAAALGYDPRYLRCECHGAGHRLAHAFLWSFLTKDASGQTRINSPVLAGAYAGGMIPVLWYPSRFNPWKDGVREGNQELGIIVGVNLITEFSPEFRRIFHRKSPRY